MEVQIITGPRGDGETRKVVWNDYFLNNTSDVSPEISSCGFFFLVS